MILVLQNPSIRLKHSQSIYIHEHYTYPYVHPLPIQCRVESWRSGYLHQRSIRTVGGESIVMPML